MMDNVRKYMKRMISCIFAALIGCLCLASCAKNTPAESYPDTQETPVTSIAAGISEAEIRAWPESLEQTDKKEVPTLPYDGIYPQHEPYGTGVGAMPKAFTHQ